MLDESLCDLNQTFVHHGPTFAIILTDYEVVYHVDDDCYKEVTSRTHKIFVSFLLTSPTAIERVHGVCGSLIGVDEGPLTEEVLGNEKQVCRVKKTCASYIVLGNDTQCS